jgi:hypothetical protein
VFLNTTTTSRKNVFLQNPSVHLREKSLPGSRQRRDMYLLLLQLSIFLQQQHRYTDVILMQILMHFGC